MSKNLRKFVNLVSELSLSSITASVKKHSLTEKSLPLSCSISRQGDSKITEHLFQSQSKKLQNSMWTLTIIFRAFCNLAGISFRWNKTQFNKKRSDRQLKRHKFYNLWKRSLVWNFWQTVKTCSIKRFEHCLQVSRNNWWKSVELLWFNCVLCS